jgi:hypothetical protein
MFGCGVLLEEMEDKVVLLVDLVVSLMLNTK